MWKRRQGTNEMLERWAGEKDMRGRGGRREGYVGRGGGLAKIYGEEEAA